ncbi:uncharacterized protein TRIVIDRAFT_67298 [Trichoderma virens Gv29-8]|uniref:Uncharacterized protein n=1 Tax=Hypocrea virens (strain Gv29-8 / FGSC 10586) TaxID=413071 RepID=G9N5P4_HYPVG|nr:uncharacterized protein TRIVIDRAFT_67298 [Trichoderma virens Gv29-8]EHK18086.1 hypothetical protein TRIVIDRAFT_67298 [Trichoderma virens Gv29-8]
MVSSPRPPIPPSLLFHSGMWNPRQTAGSVDDPAWGAVKLLLIVIKLRYNDYFRYTIEDHGHLPFSYKGKVKNKLKNLQASQRFQSSRPKKPLSDAITTLPDSGTTLVSPSLSPRNLFCTASLVKSPYGPLIRQAERRSLVSASMAVGLAIGGLELVRN